MQYTHYFPKGMTHVARKSHATGWAKRARESLREGEAALARGDYDWAEQMFMQASADCAGAESVATAMRDQEENQ